MKNGAKFVKITLPIVEGKTSNKQIYFCKGENRNES